MEKLTTEKNLENLKNELKAKITTFSSEKVKKNYILKEGNLPEKANKDNGYNDHSFIISHAILTLMKEGKKESTKIEIMERAESLGLYEIHPSKQTKDQLFSWNRKYIVAAGFLA